MKRLKHILFLCLIACFASCEQGKGEGEDVSSGNINEISIVISDVLWNGEVGDMLRRRFAAPVDGLTQEEPLFTLNQLHDKSFEGSLKKRRNIIVVEKGDQKGYNLTRDNYCKKQNVFTIDGRNIDELLEVIDMHADEIIRTIRQTEIAENQERHIKAGLLDEAKFRERFGVSLRVPADYSYAIQNEDFIWLKKDIPGGNTNLLLYRVPCDVIERNKTPMVDIIRMRDSIGSQYIHGKEPGTFMVTEESYSPYIFMTSFTDRPAFETRGNWEMANDYMSGPFLNYAIRDEKNNTFLVIEGFIYSPSSPKRDLIIELESIIKSLKFL